jgi:hypothetical protein
MYLLQQQRHSSSKLRQHNHQHPQQPTLGQQQWQQHLPHQLRWWQLSKWASLWQGMLALCMVD